MDGPSGDASADETNPTATDDTATPPPQDAPAAVPAIPVIPAVPAVPGKSWRGARAGRATALDFAGSL